MLKYVQDHFTVTAAKAALELHILQQLLLANENNVQNSTFPHWLLYQLKKGVINTFQEPGLLILCCVVPPNDVRVVENPQEDQGL